MAGNLYLSQCLVMWSYQSTEYPPVKYIYFCVTLVIYLLVSVSGWFYNFDLLSESEISACLSVTNEVKGICAYFWLIQYVKQDEKKTGFYNAWSNKLIKDISSSENFAK